MIIRNPRKAAVLLLLALFSSPLAADRVAEAIEAAKGKDTHPDAPVIDILSEITIRIAEDFSFTMHVLNVKKILNYQGKKNFSDVRIGYNADIRTVEVGNCYTVAPDGTRIPVPKNQTYDLDDRRAIANPAVNTRNTFVNFPQIEPGYYTVLEYTISDTRRVPVNGVENFQVEYPLLKKRFTMIFPPIHRVKTHFDPEKLFFKQEVREGSRVLSWEIENSAMIKQERNMPYYLVSGTPLIYTFYESWQDLAARHLPKLTAEEVDESIRRLAEDITRDIQTDRKKLVAIYTYLYKNLNYHVSITMDLDFTPIPLKTLLSQKWGTQREMTALFIALARAAGVKGVYPALLLNSHLTCQPFLRELPTHYFIDRIGVFWNDTLIGPGNYYTPFGFCGFDTLVVVGRKGYPLIHFQLEDVFTQFNRARYEVQEASVSASFNSRFSANVNQFFRRQFLNQPPARQKIWFNQMIGERAAMLTDGPNFLNFEAVDEDLCLEYKIDYRNHLVDQPPYRYMRIAPTPIFLDVSSDQRHGDFQIYTREHVREEFEIYVDADCRFLNAMEKNRITFPLGDKLAFFEFWSRSEGNRILIEREFFLPEGIVKKSNYSAFRRFILEIKDPIKHMVFLEKTGGVHPSQTSGR